MATPNCEYKRDGEIESYTATSNSNYDIVHEGNSGYRKSVCFAPFSSIARHEAMTHW